MRRVIRRPLGLRLAPLQRIRRRLPLLISCCCTKRGGAFNPVTSILYLFRMKTRNTAWLGVVLSLFATALFLPTFTAGKVQDAPGVQKKVPLEITSVVVSTTPTSVTVSWTSSQPSNGSIVIDYGFDGVGYLDPKFGVHHEVTVTGLSPGGSYGLLVESHSDKYGGDGWSGFFVTPVL
jgi:hypothetical protein